MIQPINQQGGGGRLRWAFVAGGLAALPHVEAPPGILADVLLEGGECGGTGLCRLAHPSRSQQCMGAAGSGRHVGWGLRTHVGWGHLPAGAAL